MIPETPEAQRERERCPVCRSPHRPMIERMRHEERAAYAEIYRILPPDASISLRWLVRHFTRGHQFFVPNDGPQLPGWLVEDDNEMQRYRREQGYCRTIEDLCPHVPAGTISTCEQVRHPECERFRLHTLRERLIDAEARNVSPPIAAPAGAERVALTEPLVPQQRLEVEKKTGQQRGIFSSTVLAMEPSQIVISMPTRLQETLALAAGDRVTVSYQGRVSKYVFETAVRAAREGRVDLEPPGTIGIASRRSPRVPLRDTTVRVKRVEQGGEELVGTALDASLQGVRVVMSIGLPQWERVRVTVSLPDGPLDVDGEVVRVERLGTGQIAHGIYFTSLSQQDIARLRRLGG